AITVGDGQGAVAAEVAGRGLDAGWGLAALVFVEVDHPHYTPDDGLVEAHSDDLLEAAVVLDVGLEDGIEDLVGRQAVGIELTGAELGGGRLLDDLVRDEIAASQLIA